MKLWPERRGQERTGDHVLKAVAEAAGVGERFTLEGAAALAGVGRERMGKVMARLVAGGMARVGEGGYALTEEGWKRGRELLRAHRVYELHLAEKSGLPPERWHEEADRREHGLGAEEINRLADGLHRPRYDPHGDPIPTRWGEMPAGRGRGLEEVAGPGIYRITHLEDEPAERFEGMARAGLAAGLVVEVEPREEAVGKVWDLRWGERNYRVAGREEAEAIDVEAAPEGLLAARTLADLKDGETGEVRGLSPAVRGLERRRLLDLGFVRGSQVRREGRGALGGPVRFGVRGTVIALRVEQAERIFIEKGN